VTSRNDLVARGDLRLQTAQEIVHDLDILGRWGRYGEPAIVGSVGIGVVVAPDIDIEIYSDEPRVSDGFAVMRPLAELPKSRRITYLDARDRHEQGQYWKLEYERTPDQTWTIDMWVFARDSRAATRGAALTAAVREALTAQTREHILAIKEEAAALGERAYGYWLYQAVLDAGVRSYAEFRAWLGDRNIYERTSWMPGEA
jgi:hypothetical protein